MRALPDPLSALMRSVGGGQARAARELAHAASAGDITAAVADLHGIEIEHVNFAAK